MKTPSPLRPRPLLALLPLAALAFAGCDGSPAAPADDALLSASDHLAAHAAHANRAADRGTPVRGHGDLLKAVRQQTARFNSLRQAERAGYVESSPCVSNSDGWAMGHHWVNQSMVGPTFDPMRPQALLYVPNRGGTLKLVGVEYIVIDVGQPHPEFDGVPFDVGGAPIPVDHYTLHVWAHADNPEGTFFPYNSALSCPPANGNGGHGDH